MMSMGVWHATWYLACAPNTGAVGPSRPSPCPALEWSGQGKPLRSKSDSRAPSPKIGHFLLCVKQNCLFLSLALLMDFILFSKLSWGRKLFGGMICVMSPCTHGPWCLWSICWHQRTWSLMSCRQCRSTSWAGRLKHAPVKSSTQAEMNLVKSPHQEIRK